MKLFDEKVMKDMLVEGPRPIFDDEMYNKLAIIASGYLNEDLSDDDGYFLNKIKEGIYLI